MFTVTNQLYTQICQSAPVIGQRAGPVTNFSSCHLIFLVETKELFQALGKSLRFNNLRTGNYYKITLVFCPGNSCTFSLPVHTLEI